MKNDIYVSLVNKLNDDPLTHRCKCGVLIGALTQEKLDAAIKRHKCKKVKE